jgi:kynurenine formamidase
MEQHTYSGHAMERRNWGRWGPDDERGATNLLTGERILDAAKLIRYGETISLAQPISWNTPLTRHRPAPVHFMASDGGDYAQGDRTLSSRVSDDSVFLATHTGTHIDALAHVWYGDQIFNGFSQYSTSSRSGAARCGVEKLGPLVGRGVLLDFAQENPLQDDSQIGPKEFEACLSRQGTELREGDMILLRTGWWSSRAHSPDQTFSSEPGPDVEGGRWLANQSPACVGSDNFAFEMLPNDNASFPVHELLLRDCGIPIIEGLALDELARRGVYEFLLVVTPLPLCGATASPINPVAIL